MKITCQTYNIYFEDSIAALLAPLQLDAYSSLFVLCDENTERDCLPLIEKHLPNFKTLRIPSGEANKTIETCLNIWRQLLDKGADRKSCLINLGGGVIGDMGGFCASTFMRGMAFVQMPTTLLSQVDASVGSKLGVDLDAHKNLIGLFNDPLAVCIHTGFLKTLEQRELTSGYAEVIKHALIHDAALWKELQNMDSLQNSDIDWNSLVKRSVEIKKQVVDQDPKEGGLRKILNFGHSIGHAVESERLHTEHPLTHGEAIAIGMICEAHISYQREMIAQDTLEAISAYILSHFHKDMHFSSDYAKILKRMAKDKKNEQGNKLLSLLTGIGSCTFNLVVSDNEVLTALDYYTSLA